MKTATEYKKKIDRLYREMDKAEEKEKHLAWKAHKMFDGKYATGTEPTPWTVFGTDNIRFIYPNEEAKKKEKEEKEKWLTENGYYNLCNYDNECWEEAKHLEEELCWLEHGMDEREWVLTEQVKAAEKEIEKALKKVEKAKANAEKVKAKLAEYRENREKN